jgi:hypothetical protein
MIVVCVQTTSYLDESCAENYEEITFEEWMKNFSK